MNYSDGDKLVPLTKLAKDIGFIPKKQNFDEEKYIKIKYLRAGDLYADQEFQRLLNETMIRSAGTFDPDMVRPLYVFKRPNGKYSVADGQHETIIGILYTTNGEDLPIPCQVREHPVDYTLEQCLEVEANFFKKLNFNRTNVGVIQRLRADIALKDDTALETLEKLNDMGVKIENIGEPDAVSVNGYNKLMDAYDDYGLQNVIKAIDKIEELQQDSKAAAWNDNGKPLVGGLIAGLAALYHLLPFLGRGDKSYALRCYLDNNLKMLKPVGKKSLMSDIGGDLQSTLFARRIVNSCNALIQQGYIRKRNGDLLLVQIEETVLSRAGLGDPTGTQIQSKEKED